MLIIFCVTYASNTVCIELNTRQGLLWCSHWINLNLHIISLSTFPSFNSHSLLLLTHYFRIRENQRFGCPFSHSFTQHWILFLWDEISQIVRYKHLPLFSKILINVCDLEQEFQWIYINKNTWKVSVPL